MKAIISKTAAISLLAFAAACTPKGGPSYVQSQVQIRDIYRTVSATGALEPVNKVDVGTQVSGIIDRIYVDFNSVVTKGQLLAEMDRTTLIAEVNSAQASLKSSEVELDYQKRNFDRYKRLHEKGLVSDTEFEQAEYSYNKAVEALKVQRSNMSRINRNLEYATITSPIDGVVLDRAVEEGQTVASGFNTPTLFTIAADLTEMEVIADVDEADIGHIKEGQRATFTVDAFPDDVFEGSVAQVRLKPKTSSNVVTYQVVVNAPNPEQILKPGMTASIAIYTQSELNALCVPMKALRFKPAVLPADYKAPLEKHRGTVWTLNGDKLVPHIVSTGINDGAYIAIWGDDELRSGSQVITGLESKNTISVRVGPPSNGPDQR